jgi:hypothetical protein
VEFQKQAALVLLVKVLTEEMVLLTDNLAVVVEGRVVLALLAYLALLVEMAVQDCVQPLLDSAFFTLAVVVETSTALEPQD